MKFQKHMVDQGKDVDTKIQRVGADVALARSEMKSENRDMKMEISGIRRDMKKEIEGIRSDMRSESAVLRSDIAEVKRTLNTLLIALSHGHASDQPLAGRLPSVE